MPARGPRGTTAPAHPLIPPTHPMIVAEKLTKRYGDHLAVDSVDFSVPKGEIVGFLGPNGAGKSTTLRMVAGYLPPTSGHVTVRGHDIVDESLEARGCIGYMPEAVPLYPEMRVGEYLSFRAEIKGVRAGRKAAVDRAMQQANVTDVARRLIGELSKGYRQRVGLADALVANPPLLILDEPTAGLDPNQILDVRELIKTLGKDHTIFLSTHILSEVESVCSRVVIIAKGRIVASGTPDEIRARIAGETRDATLVVRGPEPKVRELLGAADGVGIRGEPTRQDGGGDDPVWRWKLTIAKRDGADVGERLVETCVQAGIGVRGLSVSGKSLESIFHELTAEEPAATAGTPTPAGAEPAPATNTPTTTEADA